MVKVFALIPQRPDISREEFHSHWISPHGEMACGIDTLQGYVQCHRIRPGIDGLPEADYEGIAEVWFTDVETAAAMGENPVYAEQVNPDEPNFIDIDRLAFVFADERVVRDGAEIGKDDPVVKAQVLLRRAAGTSREDFDAAWAASDADFAAAFPGALRLVRSEARAESYAEGEPPADGFAEIWWPDREAFESDWAADREGYLRSLEGFADLGASSAFLSEEVRLIWPT
ncbi:MAG: EthD domain-containing protein [Actinobacteria bacterium]|nr:EthD domain-containing protein [Actinomycetota bacterium]